MEMNSAMMVISLATTVVLPIVKLNLTTTALTPAANASTVTHPALLATALATSDANPATLHSTTKNQQTHVESAIQAAMDALAPPITTAYSAMDYTSSTSRLPRDKRYANRNARMCYIKITKIVCA